MFVSLTFMLKMEPTSRGVGLWAAVPSIAAQWDLNTAHCTLPASYNYTYSLVYIYHPTGC